MKKMGVLNSSKNAIRMWSKQNDTPFLHTIIGRLSADIIGEIWPIIGIGRYNKKLFRSSTNFYLLSNEIRFVKKE